MEARSLKKTSTTGGGALARMLRFVSAPKPEDPAPPPQPASDSGAAATIPAARPPMPKQNAWNAPAAPVPLTAPGSPGLPLPPRGGSSQAMAAPPSAGSGGTSPAMPFTRSPQASIVFMPAPSGPQWPARRRAPGRRSPGAGEDDEEGEDFEAGGGPRAVAEGTEDANDPAAAAAANEQQQLPPVPEVPVSRPGSARSVRGASSSGGGGSPLPPVPLSRSPSSAGGSGTAASGRAMRTGSRLGRLPSNRVAPEASASAVVPVLQAGAAAGGEDSRPLGEAHEARHVSVSGALPAAPRNTMVQGGNGGGDGVEELDDAMLEGPAAGRLPLDLDGRSKATYPGAERCGDACALRCVCPWAGCSIRY